MPAYVSTRQLCQLLGFSRSTVHRYELREHAVMVGRQWRYNLADVCEALGLDVDAVTDTLRHSEKRG